MENFYLIDYVMEHSGINSDILDSIKYELDQHIYYYGSHFKYPKEILGNYKVARSRKLRDILWERVCIIKALFENNDAVNGKGIISSSYFTINNEIRKIGYNVYLPPWSDIKDKIFLHNMRFYQECELMKNLFCESDFIGLIDEIFVKRIEDFKEKLKDFYVKNKISALIVPNDIEFFENISIKVFKELRRPSFVFLHGLPGRYNDIDENRADYLIVWGEKIKEHYIKAGVPKDKIFVSGHPYYKEVVKPDLRFGLENVLVITKAMNGAQSGKGSRLNDRGNSILYLYSIQNVLKGIGIKSVRLRVHPSENYEWYAKFIDNKFFKFDKARLSDSLRAATLVIGPASTVFLEAVYYGVNYAVYEPSVNDIDFTNYKLAPPLDGSDRRIPVAKDEEGLTRLLKDGSGVDVTFLNDYIKTPFDINFIKKLLG